MHNASINEEVTVANHPMWSSQYRVSDASNKVLYDMHKKGFIDMVKGLLAYFNSVFEVFKYLWSNSEHFVYFVNYR